MRLKKGDTIRQGDVLLEYMGDDAIPNQNKLTRIESGLVVMGEGSDHGHFATGDVDVLEIPEMKDVREMIFTPKGEDVDTTVGYLVVNKEGKIQHLDARTKEPAEHKPIDLPNGNYRVIRQREYDPFSKQIIRVND